MTMEGCRMIPHWPDALSNLGWCLWSLGMVAAYERQLAPKTAIEFLDASEARELRHRHEAINAIVARVVAILPQPTAWRLEGTPEALDKAWQHLKSIGVRTA